MTDDRINKRYQLIDKIDLPKDVLLGMMNIRITGRCEAYIENYRNIIEYTDTVIKLQGKNVRLMIIGKNLMINCYNKEDMEIRGLINEIIYY